MGATLSGAGEQHLFRVEVVRKGALDPSFKMVLRLARSDRFDLAATDPFGRGLWRMGVDGATGSFVDDRERWSCHFDPRRPNALPRLDWGLAAVDLPPVLLGRLPLSAPAQVRATGPGESTLEDGLGRSWRVESDGRGVVAWLLDSATGTLSYRREERGAILTDEDAGTRVRWRELASESLAEPLPPLAVAGPDDAECGDADVS